MEFCVRLQAVDDSPLRQAFHKQESLQLSRWLRRKDCLCPEDLENKYEQRGDCGLQIQAMCRYFDTNSPAVFASCVGIMDSALIKVNIPWKYLSCFSAACFIIGCKWVEDDFQPSLDSLAELHGRQWKEVDLRRMEEKILQVLGWELPQCTYLTFLPPLTRALAAACPPAPFSPSDLPPFTLLIHYAEVLLLREFSFVFKPAAVALGALEHALRQCETLTPHLSMVVFTLQDALKVLDSELHEVSEVLSAEEVSGERRGAGGRPRSNKAYFPKVFEMPSDSFLPDHRLYDIPEEYADGASDSDLRTRATTSTHPRYNPDSSISDYDYTDDEEEEEEEEEDLAGSYADEEDEEEEEESASTYGDEEEEEEDSASSYGNKGEEEEEGEDQPSSSPSEGDDTGNRPSPATPDCSLLRETTANLLDQQQQQKQEEKANDGEVCEAHLIRASASEGAAAADDDDLVSEVDHTQNPERVSACEEEFPRTGLNLPSKLEEEERESDEESHSSEQHTLVLTLPACDSEGCVLHRDREGCVSSGDGDRDRDSGCEQESDNGDDNEEDACLQPAPSKQQQVCSGNELDSACDQDSDFHDCSPCRIPLVKACLDEVQACQALTFN